MKITDKECKDYVKQVKELLLCKKVKQEKFLNTLSANIEEFLEANPDADFEKLQEVLGTPQEIAESFLENESAEDIKKRMSIVNVILIGFIIACIAYGLLILLIKLDIYNVKREGAKESAAEMAEIENSEAADYIIELMEEKL